VAGIPPDIRGALRGLYMSGDRDGAARLLEQAASRAERRRSHGPLTPPAGVKAVEPPHHPGCYHCGERHKYAPGAIAALCCEGLGRPPGRPVGTQMLQARSRRLVTQHMSKLAGLGSMYNPVGFGLDCLAC